MPVDAARAKSLFLTASELADLAKRAAYLDRECGGDAELRARVEALLRANDAAPLSPVVAATMDSEHGHPQTEDFDNLTAQVGVVIAGKYSLAEVIGEGGMGTVWRAKQSEPVKRFVALKLIKAGMDSRQVLARFDAERQALALMDHPNIAKVLDGGLHDNRPFFVMELVKGVPITEYCDSQKLTPQRRLELFVSVCQAIQHAHQKGIIHRDIKPSNVLVALYDDKPVVKVIDFGVAKPTGGALTEATINTGFGSVVGTPEYMSPEQATFNNLDIDTRSDVYALGVLLYELLAGSPPFSKRELEQKGLLEMLRVVREEEPPRPSTKLSTADALPSLSANRGTEPKKLTGLLRNELDWIVMKALEKDRSRRYETANGFAADVQRYLAGEPVQAHPPSKAYQLNKFVRRYRPQVIAASLVLLALIGGVIGTTVGLIEAKKQEQKALAAAEQARNATQQAEIEKANALKAAEAEKLAKLDADAKREEAVRNLAFARKGNELLGSVFAGLDPKKIAESGRPLQDVLRENLVKAVKELEGSAIGDPLEVAAMQHTLGQSLLGLGETKLAVEVLAKARDTFKAKLGPHRHQTLNTMNSLATGYQNAGQMDQALPLLEETLKLTKANFGPNHRLTLGAMNNLATAYQDVGKQDEALPLFEEALKLTRAKIGPNHPQTISYINNLATGWQAVGKPEKALPLFEEALKLSKAILGPDHPETISYMNNVASIYHESRQLNRALPLYEETLKLMKAKLGPDHPLTLTCMNNLATCYQTAGKFDRALPLQEDTFKFAKAKLGPDHPKTLNYMMGLAWGYHQAGQLDRALPQYEETIKLLKAKLGPDHPNTLICMNNLAVGYKTAGKLDLALPLHEETLKLRKAKLGPNHPHTLASMNSLASAYYAAGKLKTNLDSLQGLQLTKLHLWQWSGTDLAPLKGMPLNWLNCGGGSQKLDLTPLAELPLDFLCLNHTQVSDLGPLKDVPLTTLLCSNTQVTDLTPVRKMRLRELALVNGKVSDLSPLQGMPLEHLEIEGAWVTDLTPLKGMPLKYLSLTPANILRGMEILRGMKSLERIGIGENQVWPVTEFWTRYDQGEFEPKDWSAFHAQSKIGAGLLSQKKYADAEPLLLKGYEGMKARENTIPQAANACIPEALDRLIKFYTDTDKPEEAQKWRAERAKYPPAATAVPERD